MAYAAHSKSIDLSFGTRLREIREQATEAFKAYRIYRKTVAELNELGPRELNDLGLNQSMIRRVALEAAYGKNV